MGHVGTIKYTFLHASSVEFYSLSLTLFKVIAMSEGQEKESQQILRFEVNINWYLGQSSKITDNVPDRDIVKNILTSAEAIEELGEGNYHT